MFKGLFFFICEEIPLRISQFNQNCLSIVQSGRLERFHSVWAKKSVFIIYTCDVEPLGELYRYSHRRVVFAVRSLLHLNRKKAIDVSCSARK